MLDQVCPSWALSPSAPTVCQSSPSRDWPETDTIVNSVSELSVADLPDVIPEHDEYRAMPHSLRHVLTPPSLTHARPRSILLESTLPRSSFYSRPRWPPSPESPVFRARQSVSSIGSCSTAHTRSAAPLKSILARHDSGISMATTTKSSRRKKRRTTPSVKFVDTPTIHYEEGVYFNAPPPRSPPSLSASERRSPVGWFTNWWKRSSNPPPRPHISGPYHISYSASLAGVHTVRQPKQKPGRLKRLWNRLTSAIR